MPTFSLAGQLRFQPTWTDTLSTTDVVDSVEIIRALTLSNGTGAGQANAYWRDVRTLAASSADAIAVAGSALPVSIFGGTGSVQFDPDKIRLFYVRNLSATVDLSLFLNDGDSLPLPAGGLLLMSWPRNASFNPANGGDLQVQNTSASSAQYEIVIVGVKAT